MTKIAALAVITVALIVGAAIGYSARPDPHYPPRYGKPLGLPANCSAYVDSSIAGYRSKRFTADEAMAGLERNCGAGGHLWRE